MYYNQVQYIGIDNLDFKIDQKYIRSRDNKTYRKHVWVRNDFKIFYYWVPAKICQSVQMFKSLLPNFLFGMNLAAIWKGLF